VWSFVVLFLPCVCVCDLFRVDLRGQQTLRHKATQAWGDIYISVSIYLYVYGIYIYIVWPRLTRALSIQWSVYSAPWVNPL